MKGALQAVDGPQTSKQRLPMGRRLVKRVSTQNCVRPSVTMWYALVAGVAAAAAIVALDLCFAKQQD
jgi:anti-sigma-K factor RskA